MSAGVSGSNKINTVLSANQSTGKACQNSTLCLLPSIFPTQRTEREISTEDTTKKEPSVCQRNLTLCVKMPFLGKDWRSPGWCWEKTDNGWKRIIFYGQEDDNLDFQDLSSVARLCSNKENIFELSSAKRKKDFYNNNTKSQFVKDKWIYVHKGSTKERQGYSTLGEALNRLDFSTAVHDLRRFNYVAKLFQLIARYKLTSLSGAAQKNYFTILEKIVQKVLEDCYNPRLVKDLLQDLVSTLHNLTVHVGRVVLVGNINIWMSRLEAILKWQEQLNNLQIPTQLCDDNGMSLSDLPIHMQNKILCKLSDACDIINLGQATPTLFCLSEDRILWKKLCYFHFSDKEFHRNLVMSKSDSVDWKLMYFTLKKHYPMKEQYGDTLHYCKHCHILFWQEFGHPCTAIEPDKCLMPVSPQDFIELFQY